MTKKGFQTIASSVAAIIDDNIRAQMLESHVRGLGEMYPRFDADKFRAHVSKLVERNKWSR